MARKVKIPNHIRKRFDREETKRLVNAKSKRRFYLIVCEGEKTEPNYFKSLKADLPKGVLNVYDFRIVGTGHNTTSLVEKAIELRSAWQKETNRPIDKMWIVFDKDSFPGQSFNAAIQTCLANRPEIDCAWTNEAFELWYLLHFHYYNSGISRQQYQSLIEHNFQARGLREYKYRKNSPEMFGFLKTYGDMETAIRNATRLERQFGSTENYADHNPCTSVHKLVAELFGLEKWVAHDLT